MQAPLVPTAGESSDGWVLTNRDPNAGAPALLWNGLIGVRISRNGNGLDYNGKPLGFYMIDEYQPGGEEKILPLPSPLLVTWAVGNELFTPDNKATHDFLRSGGTPLDARKGTGYRQSLDMKTGVLDTSWHQEAPSGAIDVSCETVLQPGGRALAQRWKLTSSRTTPFAIRMLDYSGPNDEQAPVGSDSSNGLVLTASPSRAVTMTFKLSGATLGALSSSSGFRIQEGTAPAGKTVILDRVLSFGPHSPKPLPKFTPRNAASIKKWAPPAFSFDEVRQASADSWAKKWNTDIEIDGPMDDQLAVRSFLFYLRSAIDPAGGMAISPFGLSDATYNGHVFWDADVWVFPALALVDPTEATAIPDYRIAKARQAATDFGTWFEGGRETLKGRRPVTTTESNPVPPGIKFPWESSVSGKETCTDNHRFEDHVTGSVLWGLTKASELGLAPRRTVDQACALGANFYLSLAERVPAGLSISGIYGPNEYGELTNDLYTNLLAQWLSNGRRWTASRGLSFVLPKDSKTFLTFENDPVKEYKQSSAILSLYPLQYPPAENEAAAMMDRFTPLIYRYGPAMSDSLDALIWARLGDKRAYEAWRKGWKRYTDDPLLLFAEYPNRPGTYFTTGAAGSLQAVLYGFLGFGIDLTSSPGVVWSKKLVGAGLLSIRPNLPPAWKSVKFKNFSVLGSSYTVTATHDACRVIQGE